MICEWCKRDIKPPRKLAREGRCDECESERVLLEFMIQKAKGPVSSGSPGPLD